MSNTQLPTGSLPTGRFFHGGSLKSISSIQPSAAPSFPDGEMFSLRFSTFQGLRLRTDSAGSLRLSRRCVFRRVLPLPPIFKWITTRATTYLEAQALQETSIAAHSWGAFLISSRDAAPLRFRIINCAGHSYMATD